jgi:hypothetical protein
MSRRLRPRPTRIGTTHGGGAGRLNGGGVARDRSRTRAGEGHRRIGPRYHKVAIPHREDFGRRGVSNNAQNRLVVGLTALRCMRPGEDADSFVAPWHWR